MTGLFWEVIICSLVDGRGEYWSGARSSRIVQCPIAYPPLDLLYALGFTIWCMVSNAFTLSILL